MATIVWGGSVAGLLLLLFAETRHRRERSDRGDWRGRSLVLVGLFVIFAVGFLLVISGSVGYFPSVESKGAPSEPAWAMVAAMYVAMLAGIVAQSYYFREPSPSWFSWLKPALASPIIFIPLISSYQSSLSNLTNVGLAELMMLLIAFQNGFFWKVIFDKQAELLSKANQGRGL